MGAWLTELRRNLPHDIVLHVVGTKSDVVAREPSKREVPFERCIVSSFRNLYCHFLRAAILPVWADWLPRICHWEAAVADYGTGYEKAILCSTLLSRGPHPRCSRS